MAELVGVEVDHGSLGQLDLFHVGRPDVLPGLTSLDGGCSEGGDVSKNYKGSRSARSTQPNFLWSLRIAQVMKLNAATPWADPHTVMDNQNRGIMDQGGGGEGNIQVLAPQLRVRPRAAAVSAPVASHKTQRIDNHATSKESLDVKAPSRARATIILCGHHEIPVDMRNERSSHDGNRNQVKESSGDSEDGEDVIILELHSRAQDICRESGDNQSE